MIKRGVLLIWVTCIISNTWAVENEGDDPLQWLRDTIPGEPGVDYPIMSSIEETGFNCQGKVFGGYYADPEADCQMYHVCLLDTGNSMYPTSFLCPNGTLFQQNIFNCDWWYNVDCSTAESLYNLADAAFGSGAAGPSGSSGTASGGDCPAINPLSDAECAGIKSNCWSPGQPDTDCPNNGLCCFNGCADVCVDDVDETDTNVENLPSAFDAPQTTPYPVTSTGYNYPVPDVTLPIRPEETFASPPSLYGAPPSIRQGRRRPRTRQGKRRRNRRGRRVLRKVAISGIDQPMFVL